MFAVMGLGCLLVKLGMLSPTTTRELGSLLLNVVFPVVIVRSFWGMYTPERLENLVFTMVLSALALGLAMLIARLVFPRDGVLEFAAAFSNAGFIGIPLVQAAFGAEAVFFIAPFIAALNVLQWTYGRWRISGSTESISMRSVLSSPMLIALILGTVLFLVRMPIPPIAQTLMGTIANLNSPLAMLILARIWPMQTCAPYSPRPKLIRQAWRASCSSPWYPLPSLPSSPGRARSNLQSSSRPQRP